eukprot:XP_011681700.1 PREDICTED: calmodulin-like [Strongylocentrotus purpuratus]
MDHQQIPEEEKELKTVFSFLDKKENGEIGVDDVGAVLRALGYRPTDEELQYMVQEVTQNHEKGSITFNEFLALMTEEDTEDDLKEMFSVFDKHDKGFISVSDLREVLIELGIKTTDRDIDEMIEEVDGDLSGHITYTDFTRIVTSQ